MRHFPKAITPRALPQVSNQSPSPEPKGHVSCHAIFCEQATLRVHAFGVSCHGQICGSIFPKTKRFVVAALRRIRHLTQRWEHDKRALPEGAGAGLFTDSLLTPPETMKVFCCIKKLNSTHKDTKIDQRGEYGVAVF